MKFHVEGLKAPQGRVFCNEPIKGLTVADLEAELNALKAKVQNLEDKEAVRTLRYRYHQYINDDRFDEIADLFTDDAVVEIGYVLRSAGREEIHAAFVAMPSGVKFLKQFIHNHIVDVDGDAATGISYFEAKYAAKDGTSLVVAGKYDEDYVRTPDGWRISRMVVELYFTTPLELGWAIENPHFLGSGGKIEQQPTAG